MADRVFIAAMVAGYAVAAGLALADHLEAGIIAFAIASLLGAPLMRSHPGVAAKVFSTLGDHKINIEMISTSPIKISCVIAGAAVPGAVRALHAAFELSGEGTIRAERPFGEFV